MSARRSPAWLLPLTGGGWAAVGLHEIFHLLPELPRIYCVPLTTPGAPGVMLWNDQLIAVLDPGRIIEERAAHPVCDASAEAGAPRIVALGAFTKDEGDWAAGGGAEVLAAALLLREAPQRIQVADDHVCATPEHLAPLGDIVSTCFEHVRHGPVPIIDLTRLFSRPGLPHSRRSPRHPAHALRATHP